MSKYSRFGIMIARSTVEVAAVTVAVLLFGLGLQQLVRHRHPRYGGMRVGPRQLTVW